MSRRQRPRTCTSRASTRPWTNMARCSEACRRSRCSYRTTIWIAVSPRPPASTAWPMTLTRRCCRNWPTRSLTRRRLRCRRTSSAFYSDAAAPDRDEEGSGQVAEGAEQPRSAEGLHAQSVRSRPRRRRNLRPRAPSGGQRSEFFCENEEECSLCKMPASALGLVCCFSRPTG